MEKFPLFLMINKKKKENSVIGVADAQSPFLLKMKPWVQCLIDRNINFLVIHLGTLPLPYRRARGNYYVFKHFSNNTCYICLNTKLQLFQVCLPPFLIKSFYTFAPANAIYKPRSQLTTLWVCESPLLGESPLPCPTPLCPTSVFNPTGLALDIQEAWFPFFPIYLC